MLKNLSTRNKAILTGIVILILIIVGYFAYQYFNPAQVVTGESQEQAETPAGILLGATNAHIPIIQDQLDEAAAEIARLRGLPPRYIYLSSPPTVIHDIEVQRETAKADFAIITNPAEPTKTVVIKEIEQLPPLTPIVLNQYNIQAYKKVVKGITLYPSFNGITPNGVSEIEGDISRKITKDGKYLGVAASYNFKHDEAMAGLRITF